MLDLPSWTSSLPEKRVLLGVDPYVRESWLDLQRLHGPGTRSWLERSALLVLRPDAMVARVGRTVLDRVHAAGFTPVASQPVRFDRHMVREIWRHDLNGTPPDRLEWIDQLMSEGDSLFVLLRDDRPDPGVPAAARLHRLKGPSKPERRADTDLRTLSGVGQASLLTYVHAADEPIDVVRELGILFDSSTRATVADPERSAAATMESTVASLAAIEATMNANTLGFEPAVQRLVASIASVSDDADRTRLLELVRLLEAGDGRSWRELLAHARRHGGTADVWDLIAIGAHVCSPRKDLPATYVEVLDGMSRIGNGGAAPWPRAIGRATRPRHDDEPIRVRGGRALSGTVAAQGSKNVALALSAAALASDGEVVLADVPAIVDVEVMADIATELGHDTRFDGNTLILHDGQAATHHISRGLGARIRASVCIAAAVLAKYGSVTFPGPGGDDFCPRPIDRHLAVMRLAGAEVSQQEETFVARLRRRPTAFRFSAKTPHGPSVGATVTALVLAARADGTSLITDPSPDYEVLHVCRFLRRCGAVIHRRPDGSIEVTGVPVLRGAAYRVPGDPSQAGTLALAAALTGGRIEITGITPVEIAGGFRYAAASAGVRLTKTASGTAVTAELGTGLWVRTGPLPQFPTDLQPLMSVLMTQLSGRSVIEERVFTRRQSHVAGLRRFGASITARDGCLLVEGPAPLVGADVSGTDIRCTAAYVLAALVAAGDSVVGGRYHLDRGYEDLVGQLRALGAWIQ